MYNILSRQWTVFKGNTSTRTNADEVRNASQIVTAVRWSKIERCLNKIHKKKYLNKHPTPCERLVEDNFTILLCVAFCTRLPNVSYETFTLGTKKRLTEHNHIYASFCRKEIHNPELYVTLLGLVKSITLWMHIYLGNPKRCNLFLADYIFRDWYVYTYV
jgi:hypothetical protein